LAQDFSSKPLTDWILDVFAKAQQAQVGLVPGVKERDARGSYDPSTNKISIDPYFKTENDTAAHEAGHAIWSQDLDPATQNAWTQLHQKALQEYNARPKAGQYANVPSYALRYPNDPSHSFADAWSQYSTSPERFKKENPEAYSMLMKASGFEYAPTKGQPKRIANAGSKSNPETTKTDRRKVYRKP